MRTNFLRKKLVAIILVTTGLLVSCEKESPVEVIDDNLIEQGGVEMKDGILHFTSSKDFFSVSKSLLEMSAEDRNVWELNLGFISMATELEWLYEENSASDDELIEEMLVSSNCDLIKLVDGRIDPIVNARSYQVICNRDGYFSVNGVLHKVTETSVITDTKGRKENIENYLINGRKSNNEDINEFVYIDNNSKYGVCGEYKTAFNNNSDRKCDMTIKTYYNYCKGDCCNSCYQYLVDLVIQNYKKNWRKKWTPYQSNCYYKDVAFTVKAPVVTGYNGLHSIFHYEAITKTIPTGQSNGQWATFTKTWEIGNRVENITPINPSLERVKGKAKNDGMSMDLWADIYCGAW